MQLDTDSLLAAQRAALSAAEPAARWWRRLEAAAGAALTEDAIDELLADALGSMREVLGADEMSLLLAAADEGELVARASVGLDERPHELHIPAGKGMAGRVLSSRQPLVVEDLREAELVPSTLREQGMLSAVAAPLVAGEHALGVLHAGSRTLACFDEADAALLAVMADRLAVALERVRRFEGEQQLRQQAEALARRLERVQQITSRLAAAASVDEAAAALAGAFAGPDAAGEQGGDHVVATLWVPSDGGLERVVAMHEKRPGPPHRLERDAGHPVARAARELQPVEATGRDGRVLAVIPLRQRDSLLGVLELAAPAAFHVEEHRFVAVVTEQLAQTLERVRLFAEQAQLSAISSFFARAARVMAEATGLEETLQRLATLALPVLGDLCLIDLLGEDGSITRMVAQHREPALQPLVGRLRSFPPDPAGNHPAAEVVRTGGTRWSDTMPASFLSDTSRGGEHLRLIDALGFRSYLSVPLVAGDGVLGALTLISTGEPFRPGDVAFAERLAQQVAAVVGNARRYDATFRTSHLLQESLLPRALPEVSGLEIATRYLAASSGLDVGGDFYDVIVLPSGRTGFMIGDVAGHDGDAAAMMGHLRSAARALAGQVRDPGDLVAALQWSWPLLGFERIATGVFGRLDQRSGELAVASAGHYPPLLLASGRASYLPVRPGPPLGAEPVTRTPQPASGEWHGGLAAGELLLCYTDGAIDERHAGVDASMARLVEVALAGPLEAESLCDRVLAMLATDRADDVALLALRRLPGG